MSLPRVCLETASSRIFIRCAAISSAFCLSALNFNHRCSSIRAACPSSNSNLCLSCLSFFFGCTSVSSCAFFTRLVLRLSLAASLCARPSARLIFLRSSACAISFFAARVWFRDMVLSTLFKSFFALVTTFCSSSSSSFLRIRVAERLRLRDKRALNFRSSLA